MNDDLCKIIALRLVDEVVGFVNVEVGERYDKEAQEKVPVFIINIKREGIHWHRWYKTDYIYDHFNSGKTVDELVDEILWKYKGYLIDKVVTKKFFKKTA